MTRTELQYLQEQWNKLWQQPQFQTLLPRQPNMRYWKKESYAYAWTTEPIKGKFYATKYRILKNGNWTLKHKVAFGRRKIAKARAKKWFEEA